MESFLPEDILEEKQRSAKFNENELSLLSSLIRKYKHIILNKKTGQVTPKQREEVWQEITIEFNSDPACSLSRTTTQLKNKWDYMKRNAKKDVAAYKKAHRQTGGGKGPAPLSDTTAILLDTVRESVEGVPSKFDSDNTISSQILVLENEAIEVLSEPISVILSEEAPFHTKLNDEQPIMHTPNQRNKNDSVLIKDHNDLSKESVPIKKRKLMKDSSLMLSTPQYTRSKFVEVAEKKIQLLEEKENTKNKKTALELEILEKKAENASLENKKLQLECEAVNMEIDIKKLIKKKLELELTLMQKEINKNT